MAEGHFSKARIEAYLGRTFTRDEVTISNAGQTDSLNYISYWKPELEKSQPTEEQLIAIKADGDAIVKSNQARNARRNAYGNIGDQLDEIFHDIDAWKARIQQIKSDNPKE